ncbi:MAG: helix-turn-helix domain-containing protein [Tomitella sp.]|nr:helix-turn-helix domain-containing protein [Tomitella sp.]
MAMSFTPRVAEWLADFASAAENASDVDAWVARIDGAILAEVPEIADDPLLKQDLHASTRAHWLGFLQQLPSPGMEVTVPQEATQLALSIALRGLELGILLKVYRVAQQATWEYAIDVADGIPEGGPQAVEILVPLWSRAGVWIDRTVEQLIVVYEGERSRIRQGAMAKRVETVGHILAGGPMDVPRVSGELGYPMHQWHTAYVVWVDDNEVISSLEQAASLLGRMLGASAPLIVTQGSRDLWCWVATSGPPDLQSLDDAVPRLRQHRIRAAFGVPADGIEGFRASHHECLAAQRLSAQASGRHPVVRYRDVELIAILSADSAAADAFAGRILGPLAGDEKGADRIRRTLYAVLDGEQGIDEVAAEMFVHKNTIRYRLNQAEERLGYAIHTRRADLTTALRWLDFRGCL